MTSPAIATALLFRRSWSLLLALTCDDLDPLSLDVVGIVQLELDVLDDEGPDFVAETVGVKVSL